MAAVNLPSLGQCSVYECVCGDFQPLENDPVMCSVCGHSKGEHLQGFEVEKEVDFERMTLVPRPRSQAPASAFISKTLEKTHRRSSSVSAWASKEEVHPSDAEDALDVDLNATLADVGHFLSPGITETASVHIVAPALSLPKIASPPRETVMRIHPGKWSHNPETSYGTLLDQIEAVEAHAKAGTAVLERLRNLFAKMAKAHQAFGAELAKIVSSERKKMKELTTLPGARDIMPYIWESYTETIETTSDLAAAHDQMGSKIVAKAMRPLQTALEVSNEKQSALATKDKEFQEAIGILAADIEKQKAKSLKTLDLLEASGVEDLVAPPVSGALGKAKFLSKVLTIPKFASASKKSILKCFENAQEAIEKYSSSIIAANRYQEK